MMMIIETLRTSRLLRDLRARRTRDELARLQDALLRNAVPEGLAGFPRLPVLDATALRTVLASTNECAHTR